MAGPGGAAAAFWLLGLLNNSIFVVLNAGATLIVPGGVGVIYLCNNLPNLVVTVSGPYWFHRVAYRRRVLLCGASFATGVSLVALAKPVWLRLLGVMVGSFAQGLGEASMLARTSFYGRTEITAWSSGTGFAGIFGYAWKALFVDLCGLTFNATLLLANVLPLAFVMVYFGVLYRTQTSLQVVDDDVENDEAACFVETNGRLSEACANSYLRMSDENDDSADCVQGTTSTPMLTTTTTPTADLADPSSFGERLRLFSSLWPFTVPLFVVYIAEYAMQSGTWAAMGFPVHDKGARDKFYLYSNWLYQVGVFLSRSSGGLFRLSLRQLWVIPLLQFGLLVFFIWDAVVHVWWNASVLILCLLVGMFGGAIYVHAMLLMEQRLPSGAQEFAMASAAGAATTGTALANVLGIIIQGCLFAANDITDQGPPLFTCGREKWDL
ncbi:Protein BTN1 [Hondaea fermentalgiana]|uniref:Protein BTN1 n=1 Tax=Hondaea fermentalgiana TaxID=2315210 RepID=A0A2R5GTG0_9STRA|nr:Protein BTN1 [Hondaea fermentalgiana]|eukprot:GBG31174.1 Protein BTN1 [Hondaea fermentalgiana]